VGLLEALAGGAAGERSAGAVTRHLQCLLGSLQGYSCVLPDYGLRAKTVLGLPGPDDDDTKPPEERLRQELLRNVLQFEPALCEPELTICRRDPRGQVYFLLDAGLFRAEPRCFWLLRFNVWSRELFVEEATT
jgi:hypothetical protein